VGTKRWSAFPQVQNNHRLLFLRIFFDTDHQHWQIINCQLLFSVFFLISWYKQSGLFWNSIFSMVWIGLGSLLICIVKSVWVSYYLSFYPSGIVKYASVYLFCSILILLSVFFLMSSLCLIIWRNELQSFSELHSFTEEEEWFLKCQRNTNNVFFTLMYNFNSFPNKKSCWHRSIKRRCLGQWVKSTKYSVLH
jgi:hypothetical protein